MIPPPSPVRYTLRAHRGYWSGAGWVMERRHAQRLPYADQCVKRSKMQRLDGIVAVVEPFTPTPR